MVALIKTLQVILALSLLIFVHELGHFMWAKIFRIRVEKFFLFFDVGGKALFRFRKGETEFGIGWLPLGGYCKIAGMIDESLDREQLKRDPQPWEFRAHPAWQRLLVMAGGVLNNFLTAILIFIIIMGVWGETFIPNSKVQAYPTSLGEEMGFKAGDRILKLDDYVPEDFASINSDIVRKEVSKVTVLRGGDTAVFYLDANLFAGILSGTPAVDIALPFVVDSISADCANVSCGLQKGDSLVSIGGTPVVFLQDARKVLSTMKGTQTKVFAMRGAALVSANVEVDTLGRIGVYMKMPPIERRSYNALEAIPAGLRMTGQTISGYLKDLKLLATPSSGAYKSVGSFIAIGQVFPASWDWFQFIYILAILSIMLGVMNLLPIPALDGGHILFTLYEIITGRKPSERFLYVAQLIGMVLLIALMMLAFGNDIGRLIK